MEMANSMIVIFVVIKCDIFKSQFTIIDTDSAVSYIG